MVQLTKKQILSFFLSFCLILPLFASIPTMADDNINLLLGMPYTATALPETSGDTIDNSYYESTEDGGYYDSAEDVSWDISEDITEDVDDGTPIAINEANFPDDYFRGYISSNIDTDHDGILSSEEIFNTTSMDIGFRNISSLKGIEYFIALTRLDCGYNDLTSLDVSGCTALTELYCDHNKLTSLDVSGCTALTELNCYSNSLTSLDVSSCTALTYLECGGNDLTSLDVSGCTALTTLHCYANNFTSLDVSNNTALTTLDCEYNNLTSLDVSSCTALTGLSCYDNSLTVGTTGNTVDTATLPGNFDASKVVSCSGGSITNGIITFDEGSDTFNYEYQVSDDRTESFVIYIEYIADMLSIAINEANFPDDYFRGYISSNIDTDHDGILSSEEIFNTTSMDIGFRNISSLKGIEYFIALTRLDCGYNDLTSLDVSGCTALTELNCYNNSYYANTTEVGVLDLSTLPEGFDISKAFNWRGGTVEGNIVTVDEYVPFVTYSYWVSDTVAVDFTVYVPRKTEGLGDFDGDGSLTSSDYLHIQTALCGTTTLDDQQSLLADMNGDSMVTASDLIALTTMIKGD